MDTISAKCPVCGMTVDTAPAPNRHAVGRDTYCFGGASFADNLPPIRNGYLSGEPTKLTPALGG